MAATIEFESRAPRALAAVTEIDRILDAELAGDLGLAPSVMGEALVTLGRVATKIDALRLRVLHAADTAEVAAESGAVDTAAWAAHATHADVGETVRQVRLASAVTEPGSPLGTALAAGVISTAHAAVIADARFPESVTSAQRHEIQGDLVEKAERMTPARLRRAARRAIARIEPDPEVVDAEENQQLADEESAAYEHARFSLHDNGDGTTSGHFTVPTLHAAMLRKLLQALTAPRRAKPGAGAAHGDVARMRRDPGHAAGLAFAELIEHLPTDRLTQASAATVVIHFDADLLAGALRAAGLETGERISGAQALRLACGAGLIPAVLTKAGSRVTRLDLGRATRLFSHKHWISLSAAHETCAAHGCERPFAWCELHHRTPWAAGGGTDLENAIPLCWFHHRRIHDPAYDHTERPDGAIEFARRQKVRRE